MTGICQFCLSQEPLGELEEKTKPSDGPEFLILRRLKVPQLFEFPWNESEVTDKLQKNYMHNL